MSSAEWLTPPPLGVGSPCRAVMGARWPVDIEITLLDRPRRLASRTSSSWMSTEGAIRFTEDASGGTVISWDWDYRLRGPVRLLGPAFATVRGRWSARTGSGCGTCGSSLTTGYRI